MDTLVSIASRTVLAFPIKRLLIKKITGLENIPEKGSFILASNHLSHVDSLMCGYLMTPRKFTFLSQTDQYSGLKKVLRNTVYCWGGVIPFNRKDSLSKKQAIATGITKLREGYRLVIYPEGGRSYDGIMREFKPGVAVIHLESGAPVLPIALKGTREILPPHGRFKITKSAEITIGRILDFSKERKQAVKLDKKSEEYRKICDNIAKKIENEVRGLL